MCGSFNTVKDRVVKPNASKAKGISRWKDSLKNIYTGYFRYKNLTLGSLAGQEKMWFSLTSHVCKSGRQPGRAEGRWGLEVNNLKLHSSPGSAITSCVTLDVSFHCFTTGTIIPTAPWDKAAARITSVCTQHSAQNIAVGAQNGFWVRTRSARCRVDRPHPSPFPLSPP